MTDVQKSEMTITIGTTAQQPVDDYAFDNYPDGKSVATVIVNNTDQMSLGSTRQVVLHHDGQDLHGRATVHEVIPRPAQPQVILKVTVRRQP